MTPPNQITNDGGEFCWLGEEDYPDWDRFVGNHLMGTVYHLSGWRGFLEEVFPHMKGKILALRDPVAGEIRAGIPLYGAKSFLMGTRIVTSPFATLGGALVASAGELDRLLLAVLENYEGSGIRRFELRGMRPSQVQGAGSQRSDNLHHYIDLPKSAVSLKRRFAHGIRSSISRAVNAGVQVKESTSIVKSGEFGRLHQGTRRRLGLPVFPDGFFEALCDRLPESVVRVHSATLDGETLGALLSLDHEDWTIYEYYADTGAARRLGVSQLLLWKSMERAIADGRLVYSLGRTSSRNAGLLQFKRAWGASEENLATLVYSSEGMESVPGDAPGMADQCARYLFKTLPVPLARQASGFLYRHWA